MTVCGEGVEGDIADHTDIRGGLLDHPDRLRNQTIRIERLASRLVFFRRIDMREEGDGRNAEITRFNGRVAQGRQRQPIDARHGRNRLRVSLIRNDDRPDQIIGRQHVLAHQSPRPVGLPQAAHSG